MTHAGYPDIWTRIPHFGHETILAIEAPPTVRSTQPVHKRVLTIHMTAGVRSFLIVQISTLRVEGKSALWAGRWLTPGKESEKADREKTDADDDRPYWEALLLSERAAFGTRDERQG
jgi:hypothetical protein